VESELRRLVGSLSVTDVGACTRYFTEAALHSQRKSADATHNKVCALSSLYTVGHEKRDTLLLSISLLIIAKFFHWHILQTICNNVIIIYSTTW